MKLRPGNIVILKSLLGGLKRVVRVAKDNRWFTYELVDPKALKKNYPDAWTSLENYKVVRNNVKS